MSKIDFYVASCVPDGGILHCVWDGSSIRCSDRIALDQPMYIDIHGNTLHTILLKPWPDSVESAYLDICIAGDGSLGDTEELISTQGECACHISHAVGRVYAANYMSGSASSSDGLFDRHHGTGIHPIRQDAPHVHFIAPSPDGKYLLSADLGLDTVFVYDHDLNIVSTAKVPSGHGCRHLCCSDDGQFVYCANELTSTVSCFGYHDGRLKLLDTVDSLPCPNPDNYAAAIRIFNGLIYVSQRGEDAVSVLKHDGDGLKLLGMYPCGGRWPRDILVFDGHMFVANEHSHEISVLKIKGDALADTGIRFAADTPVCIAVR